MREIKNTGELQEMINAKKSILIDFYAEWCGPCQSLMPTLEGLSESYKNSVDIVKVNVDQNQELAAQFQVRSIPALFFIQDGKVVERMQGLQNKATLQEKLDQIKPLTSA